MTEFEKIVSEYGPLIRRIARSYEADAGRAEEVAQDIRVALWKALRLFRGEASLRTYVARVAHNAAIRHVARASRQPRFEEVPEALAAPGVSPEEHAAEANLRAKLEAEVLRLPLSLKVVATLALEGFATQEIAEVLGITESSAAVRLHRAKEKLRNALKGIAT